MIKYGLRDARPVLERASARETAGRVAAGAVARRFLAAFGIHIGSYVVEIGGIVAQVSSADIAQLLARAEESQSLPRPTPAQE